MPKIILQKLVKYKGEKIPANVPFNVTEEELPTFVAEGCHIFEEVKEEKTSKSKKSE